MGNPPGCNSTSALRNSSLEQWWLGKPRAPIKFKCQPTVSPTPRPFQGQRLRIRRRPPTSALPTALADGTHAMCALHRQIPLTPNIDPFGSFRCERAESSRSRKTRRYRPSNRTSFVLNSYQGNRQSNLFKQAESMPFMRIIKQNKNRTRGAGGKLDIKKGRNFLRPI